MEMIVQAESLAYLEGRLCLRAVEGERIFLEGPRGLCDGFFELLCGIRKPERGTVRLPEPGQIGAVTRSGGLISEMPMIEQAALPLLLAGWRRRDVLDEIKGRSPAAVPVHRLYDLPGRSSPRVRAWAVMLRSLIHRPKLVVVNGLFEEQAEGEKLCRLFLEALPKETVLVYLSSMRPPEQIPWTQNCI